MLEKDVINNSLSLLLKKIHFHFGLQDLRELCFNLGVDYEDLGGEGLGKKERILNLIEMMNRTGSLPQLLSALKEERPKVDWPVVPMGLGSSEAGDDDVLPKSTINKSKFKIGDIHALQVNIGGEQTFKAPISINMGEVQKIGNQLDNVSKVISELSEANEFEKEELNKLIQALKAELAKAPSERTADAENVAKRAEVVINELQGGEPDKEMVQILCKSLNRAAQNVADVLPKAPNLANQFEDLIMKMI